MFINVEKLEIKSREYFNKRAISNSSLSYLNPDQGGCPEIFDKYINGEEWEDSDKGNYVSFQTGKIVHKFIEEAENFAIANVNKPTAMMGDLCDLIVDLSPHPDTWTAENIFNISNERGLYKSIKNPSVLLENFEKAGGVEYCMWALESKDKEYAITIKDEDILLNIIENIQKNSFIKDIIYNSEMLREEVLVGQSPIGEAKCMIDRRLGNTIYEVKTTSGRIENFNPEYYHYNRQEAFYRMMLASINGVDYDTINHFYIVCETTFPYRVRVLESNIQWCIEGIKEIDKLFSYYKAYMKDSILYNNTITKLDWKPSLRELQQDYVLRKSVKESVR